MKFPTLVATELIKLRRSRVTWLSFAAYTFMVAIAGLFLWMAGNPRAAASLGLLGQKANFAFGGQNLDWPTFLTFIVEMGGVGGLVICSIVTAYVFGREYAEGTAKNLLALPIARSRFVLASIFGHTGWAPWVPWSILGLYSGVAGAAVDPGWGSILVILATFVLGTGLTIRHEVRADNGQ